MIMNHLIGPVSDGSNCEEDKFYALLSNINEMLLDYDTPKTDEADESDETEAGCKIELDSDDNVLEVVINNPSVNYEEGMLASIVFDPIPFTENESMMDSTSKICQKLLKRISCDTCKASMQEPEPFDLYDEDV